MKPINVNEILNKKVLIICNSIGSSMNKVYCSYFIGKIIDYNPEDNTVIIENKNKDIKKYNIINKDHDPFNFSHRTYNNDNRFAYYRSDELNSKIWYDVFIGDKALTILKNNIKHSQSQYVYKVYCLSSFSYNRNKTKKRFLRDLLTELEENYQ